MQTRKRVLINAFTVRALRDTFSPARGAGIKFVAPFILFSVCHIRSIQVSRLKDFLTYYTLISQRFSVDCPINDVIMTGIMALCATSGYYDSAEIATRILPNIIVLTVDPDRCVMMFNIFNTFLSSHPHQKNKKIIMHISPCT